MKQILFLCLICTLFGCGEEKPEYKENKLPIAGLEILDYRFEKKADDVVDELYVRIKNTGKSSFNTFSIHIIYKSEDHEYPPSSHTSNGLEHKPGKIITYLVGGVEDSQEYSVSFRVMKVSQKIKVNNTPNN